MIAPERREDVRPHRALSFSAIERLLGLSAGSAHARRLTIVSVGSMQVAGSELRRNDRLIVEPGAHPTAGRLLGCQSQYGIVLRRARLDARGQPVLASTDPQLLPLPTTYPCTVIGTVLAGVRTRYDGKTRVALPPRYDFVVSQRRQTSSLQARYVDSEVRRANEATLEAVLEALEAPAMTSGTGSRPIAAAARRLRSLGDCLAAVEDDRIYRALARQINAEILRLRRTLATNRSWVPLRQSLRPLACDTGLEVSGHTARSQDLETSERQRT